MRTSGRTFGASTAAKKECVMIVNLNKEPHAAGGNLLKICGNA